MPTLRNLTPHPICLVLPSGRPVLLAPAGLVARVVTAASETQTLHVEDEAVEVVVETLGDAAVLLPSPQAGVVWVVSRAVAERAPERTDLVVPATGPGEGAVRDEAGGVVAVTRLKRFRRGLPTLPAPAGEA